MVGDYCQTVFSRDERAATHMKLTVSVTVCTRPSHDQAKQEAQHKWRDDQEIPPLAEKLW